MRHKILITVVAYPLPSRSYDELVCTAGFDENGDWIRIYPVPLKFLKGLKQNEKTSSYKYNWIELDLKRRLDDFRPESYSPIKYDFSDLKVMEQLDTKNNWELRKNICLKKVYENIKELISDSKAPKNTSLAVFKPTEIIDLIIKEDKREWKNEWTDLRKQRDLFQDLDNDKPEKIIPKLPYKFYYHFKDNEGKESKLMIEDWELGSLYWKCLERSNNDEEEAKQKVIEKYLNQFTKKNDLYLFLGTTKLWHQRRATNPFVIVGIFYPLKDKTAQYNMFK